MGIGETGGAGALVSSLVMKNSVMIVGVSGQTGAYLAQAFAKDGRDVVGASRDVSSSNLWRLERLGVQESVEMAFMSPSDFRSVYTTLERVRPDAVYFLAGQSSVGASFQQPYETLESIAVAVQNILEAIRLLGRGTIFVNSASSDMFGHQRGVSLDENSSMRPVSPYGVAKMASYWTTVQYREAFGLKAFNAILSNHESPLRGDNFVSRKIIRQLQELKEGSRLSLEFGNLAVERDWLWAGDVAEALSLLLPLSDATDFVVASGETHTLSELVAGCATALGLGSDIPIEEDPLAARPSDIPSVRLNPQKFMNATGWKPRVTFEEMTQKLALAQV